MSTVLLRAYTSPKLVLLCFDWPDGTNRENFIGFAIERKPGFAGAPVSILPNRLRFSGAAQSGAPSDQYPIQKFAWWDANFADADTEKTFTYTVTPVCGDVPPSGAASVGMQVQQDAASIRVTLQPNVVGSIGTWFNRAVVSSQAFTAEFGAAAKGKVIQGATRDRALAWLADGLQDVIPAFLSGSPDAVTGAIYHLTDEQWTIPALQSYRGGCSFVYDAKDVRENGTVNPTPNAKAVSELTRVRFYPRTKVSIMHDKFIVRTTDGKPTDVLCGSANFTTEGLSAQANLLHTFASPELASLYARRAALLQENLTLSQTSRGAGWSDPIRVDEAVLHVYFPPAKKDDRESLDAIVDAVNGAKSSVMFCVFDPTDTTLLDACFAAGRDKLMLGLVNSVASARSVEKPHAQAAQVAIFTQSKQHKDVYAHANFGSAGAQPDGFWWEANAIGGIGGGAHPVYVHHKFVLIDAETDDPTIFTGSMNLSANSMWHNDENLIEITGSSRLAKLYLAEFIRLYEHYRARAQWQARAGVAGARAMKGPHHTLTLKTTNEWAREAYVPNSPNYFQRISLAGGPKAPLLPSLGQQGDGGPRRPKAVH